MSLANTTDASVDTLPSNVSPSATGASSLPSSALLSAALVRSSSLSVLPSQANLVRTCVGSSFSSTVTTSASATMPGSSVFSMASLLQAPSSSSSPSPLFTPRFLSGPSLSSPWPLPSSSPTPPPSTAFVSPPWPQQPSSFDPTLVINQGRNSVVSPFSGLSAQVQAPMGATALPGFATPAAIPYPAFVVGPGFPPVAPKLVGSIVAGDFVDLALLLEDAREEDTPAFSLWDDPLVLRPQRRRKAITNILVWVQAFTIFSLVLSSYHPHRAIDLMKYKLLILRLSQQVPGLAWLNYDQAFRRESAALRRTDWSTMSPELFHFHTVTQPTERSGSSNMSPPSSEAPGSPQASIICRSWNAGWCSSKFRQCRFRHACDHPGCDQLHRRAQSHGAHGVIPQGEPRTKRSRDQRYF